jgi:hypothetical protein
VKFPAFTARLFGVDNPYVQKIRAEFLNTLKKEMPKILVISSITATGKTGYDYIRQFPKLDAWIYD